MSCSELPTLSYAEFDERLKNNASARHIPLSLTLETTYRCDVSCVHCYVPGDTDRLRELSTEEICGLLDDAADMGSIFLLLSGGDPLVRSDFLETYEYAIRKGYVITLFTSGTLVTDEVADTLAQLPPFAVEITVHSMRPDVFESISSVPGSFDRCMEGIERLRSRGITLRLKSVAMRQNFEWLSEVEEFAESIGATYRFDSAIIPQLDLSQEPLETRLSVTEIVALDMASPKRVENFLELAKMKSPATFDRVYNCGGGRRAFSVNPYGRMSICSFAQYDSYDLRSGTLAEGWYDFIPEMLSHRPPPENPCPTCELLWLCHRCAAKAYLESGHEEAKIPFWCEVAEMRRHALAPLMSAEDIAHPGSPSAPEDTRLGIGGR